MYLFAVIVAEIVSVILIIILSFICKMAGAEVPFSDKYIGTLSDPLTGLVGAGLLAAGIVLGIYRYVRSALSPQPEAS
jgi:hypothetical protein